MRWVAATLWIAWAAAAEPEPESQTVRLEWRHDRPKLYVANEYRTYKNPPARVDALEGGEVRYFSRSLGRDRTLLAAHEPGHEPPRTWIDLDFDGQLTDEKPIVLTKVGTSWQVQFRFGWRDRDDAAPHPMPAVLAFDTERAGWVSLQLLGHRLVRAEFGGRQRLIVALSGESDLRLESGLFADLDGNGNITMGEDSHERIVPGTPFRAGRHGFVIRAGEPTGPDLRIEPVRPAPKPAARPWPAPRQRPAPEKIWTTRSTELDELVKRYEQARKGSQTGLLAGIYDAHDYLEHIASKGSADAVRFLLRVIRREKDSQLRETAARVLATERCAPQAKLVLGALKKARRPESIVALLVALEAYKLKDVDSVCLELLSARNAASVYETAAEVIAGLGGHGRKELRRRVGTLKHPHAAFFAYLAATRFSSWAPHDKLLATALESKCPSLRLRSLLDAQWLGQRDAHAEIVALATQEIARKRINPVFANLVLEGLGPVAGGDEMPLLIAAVPFAAPERRRQLVETLGLLRDEAAAAVLRSALSDRDAAVRRVAGLVLARVAGPKNHDALGAHLPREKSPEVRAALVNAIGLAGVSQAGSSLVAVIRRERKGSALREAALIALARIGFESKAVADYFGALAASRAWLQRLDATDTVARYSGASAIPFLAARLKDEEWRVRVAAANGLGRIRTRAVIPPLIDTLETEEERRARRAVADALFRTTGEYLYDIHKAWVKWWAAHHRDFAVPAEIPRKKQRKGERRTVAEFYGVPVDSERVIFVIDQSGSMGSFGDDEETDLDRAVQETLKVVAKLPDSARVNVVLFESGIRAWSKGLRKLGKKARHSLTVHLTKQEPKGGTNLYDALELALKMKGVDTIYLLSDGSPTSGKFVDDDDILREIGKRNRRLRVQIHCISLGYGSTLLEQLAEQSGGTYTVRR